MSDLRARVEVAKLATELQCAPEELAFLEKLGVTELRELRGAITESLFARHEARFAGVAGLTKLVPTKVAAKIAQVALGPLVTARIAGAVDPKVAASMAQAIPADFLCEVAALIDPARVVKLMPLLPDDLVIEVGRLLIERERLLALARFVPVVPTATALAVVEGAEPRRTLQVALFTEDPAALEGIVHGMADDQLLAIVADAVDGDEVDDVVTLIAGLGEASQDRLVRLSAGIEGRRALLEAIDRNDAWEILSPTLGDVGDVATAEKAMAELGE